MSISIKDVANAAGVSIASVSRVLSGKPGVGEDKAKRIKEIAMELGYRPNLGARGLVKQQTGNIAIVSPRQSNIVLDNPFYVQILHGVSKVLDKEDYNIILSFTLSQQKRLIETYSVDGVLLLAAREGDFILKEWLDNANIPTIVVGNFIDEEVSKAYPFVRPDDEEGIYKAVKHLIKNGHKDISLINGPSLSLKSPRCLKGYLTAMHEEGLQVSPEMIIETKEFDMAASFETMNQIFSDPSFSSTAIVCATDNLAFGVMKAASVSGISVPEELSVVGFGDTEMAEFSNPGLSSMHTDLVEMGKQASDMLISLIQGKTLRKTKRIFPMQLIERQSVLKKSESVKS
ncbi:LacI family DNA-binding transcriptional regulator [Alkalihalobacillus sp. BA299]|uniref:LacI family DNA-binding transcriptional regulator n=1 Tax=Alkalihalobacillus sp. BA299 TaxID=2815938 RepID=UPI001ADA7FD6|nr:LacI family DNA-binding transcriptional regulator [Alkalihalobacillus sp. BA299]